MKSPASGLDIDAEALNPSCCGKPVLILNCSDCVVTLSSSEPIAVASTRTGVGIVPESTLALTNPLELLVLLIVVSPLEKLIPPTLVSREKSTCCCAIAWPLASDTLKVINEDSLEPVPPVPLMRIEVGSAETKLKLAKVWLASEKSRLAAILWLPATTVAVIWSSRSLLPLQLLFWKVELAVPERDVTGESILALLLNTQLELKLTLVGVCRRV